MNEQPTFADFTLCVNSAFRVVDGSAEAFELRLKGVTAGASNPGYEVFSLVLRGPADRFLPQSIHKLDHDRLGSLEIFLVPVGQDQEGYEYEAVFNRILHAD